MGQVLGKTELLTEFYNNHIPFELTGAQKRVIRESFKDLKSGKQMNRLIQGDVGSGKTMVAFICALIAISSGAQTCLMAPTEILANQHYEGLKEFSDMMGIKIALLTGSSKKAQRRVIHEDLFSGELKILIGTHALLEDIVQFKNLGLAIVDEQHRFGVAQRAKLWAKNEVFIPHVLVMTATPIPRTLAMTLYGDLDISVIDELPAGRKPIQTVHRFDKDRLKVFGFINEEVKKGRQVYIVYPLIEESKTLDLKNVIDGFESITRAFPNYPVSILNGDMKAAAKDYEMKRFIKGETKIMVATTVIEVGVNVPNASVMIIENAERFGLSQLHQLRGRVGRGAEQSYCVLMSKYELSKDSRVRLNTMVRTNDGFEIADVDLRLRGPGDLMGTQQSGITDLLIADLSKDAAILTLARDAAQQVLANDPTLNLPENAPILRQIRQQKKHVVNWSRIS
jgi:ATP-dependent DNA helicase RecG